jgi:eukaryotic-like serine/threonine-protein kinase
MKNAVRFVPLAKIASGATATVYVGAPVRGPKGTLVALKRPHPHVLDDERQRETLLREARVASALHHPNLIEVREVETFGQELQLVMDYVEGAALGTLIALEARGGGSLPTGVAVRVVLDACAGLEAVHEQRGEDGRLLGLVHRDVSPQNIIVGIDGVARLTDFGLAKAIYEGAPSTTQGTLKGKLGYMAPEYVSRGRLTSQVDVFALGVVLWEALAGQRLFRGDNEIQTLDRILRELPPPLASLVPALAPFDPVVAAAVAKDPTDRLPSARAFAEALEQAARSTGAVATAEEVGAYVTRVVGAELAERRARVGEAARQRSRRVAIARVGWALGLGVPLLAAAAVVAVRGRTAPPAVSAEVHPPAAAPLPAPSTPPMETANPSPPAPETSAPPTLASAPPPPPSPHVRTATPTAHGLPPNPYVHHAPPR